MIALEPTVVVQCGLHADAGTQAQRPYASIALMRIELWITAPVPSAARAGADTVQALATCAHVGFEMQLIGATWIASYIEVLQALGGTQAEDPAHSRKISAALALLERIAAGTLDAKDAALPLHLIFTVGDWDVPDAILGAPLAAPARKLPHC